MNIIVKNIIRFILLVLVQVAILNNIQVSGYINPYVYVLFILALPFEIPKWLLLSVSFLLGLTIDIFSGTPGVNASASVFMGYLRPYILNLLSPRDGYEIGTFPNVSYFGFSWFFKYAVVLVFAHHVFLFFIEVFSFANFGATLLRIFVSTILSLILIFITEFFFAKK